MQIPKWEEYITVPVGGSVRPGAVIIRRFFRNARSSRMYSRTISPSASLASERDIRTTFPWKIS